MVISTIQINKMDHLKHGFHLYSYVSIRIHEYISMRIVDVTVPDCYLFTDKTVVDCCRPKGKCVAR